MNPLGKIQCGSFSDSGCGAKTENAHNRPANGRGEDLLDLKADETLSLDIFTADDRSQSGNLNASLSARPPHYTIRRVPPLPAKNMESVLWTPGEMMPLPQPKEPSFVPGFCCLVVGCRHAERSESDFFNNHLKSSPSSDSVHSEFYQMNRVAIDEPGSEERERLKKMMSAKVTKASNGTWIRFIPPVEQKEIMAPKPVRQAPPKANGKFSIKGNTQDGGKKPGKRGQNSQDPQDRQALDPHFVSIDGIPIPVFVPKTPTPQRALPRIAPAALPLPETHWTDHPELTVQMGDGDEDSVRLFITQPMVIRIVSPKKDPKIGTSLQREPTAMQEKKIVALGYRCLARTCRSAYPSFKGLRDHYKIRVRQKDGEHTRFYNEYIAPIKPFEEYEAAAVAKMHPVILQSECQLKQVVRGKKYTWRLDEEVGSVAHGDADASPSPEGTSMQPAPNPHEQASLSQTSQTNPATEELPPPIEWITEPLEGERLLPMERLFETRGENFQESYELDGDMTPFLHDELPAESTGLHSSQGVKRVLQNGCAAEAKRQRRASFHKAEQ